MKGGMWNKWGAQQVYYSTEMKGLSALYDEANFLPYIPEIFL